MKKIIVTIMTLMIVLSTGYGQGLSLYAENDLTHSKDQFYTHGTKITYMDNESEGYFIGQNIYTPSNIEVPYLIVDERPYAGWLHVGFISYDRDFDSENMLEFSLGVVGPYSYAEETQKQIHEWTNSREPKGWDNQIKTEPIANAVFKRSWLVCYSSNVGAIPHVIGAFGNALTYAGTGIKINVGHNVPKFFNDNNIALKDNGNLSTFIFAEGEGRAVARNIFLDGNTFVDSHHVDKKYFVIETRIGLTISYRGASLTLADAYMSKEFEGQDKSVKFSSLSISKMF